MHRETSNIESIHIRIETWIKVYDNDAITYHPVARSRKFPPMFRREHFARGARTWRITFDRIRSTLKSRITIFTTPPMIPRVPCTFDVAKRAWREAEVEDDVASLSLYLCLGRAHSSTGGKISMAKCKGGGRWKVERLVEKGREARE